jgi:hypothetical protein
LVGAECEPSATDGENETVIAAALRAVEAGDALEMLTFVGAFGAAASAESNGRAKSEIPRRKIRVESFDFELSLTLKVALTRVNPK